MVNKKRLINLTRKLIEINSENPPGDESLVAAFVKGYLEKLGLKVETYEFRKRRANVVAYLKRRKTRPSLLITPHLDTVPCGKGWRFDPFSAAIEKDRIYGLGATDCKGNLACGIEAINSIVEDGTVLDYNLIFAATADEESGSDLGLLPLLERGILKPDAALVLDSDDFNIVITQKGLLHLKVKIWGRRSHGAYPWRGVNAIDIAMDILRDVKKRGFSYARNKYLRPPTINIGTIRGGDKVNIVADWCEFELDFRYLPGMTAEDFLRDLRHIIQRHAKRSKIEIEGIQQPYFISRRHPLVFFLKKAMSDLKVKPFIKGSEGATVITFFQKQNIPAIATGFGSECCAHTKDEYAKIEDLFKGALVLEEFLKKYKFC